METIIDGVPHEITREQIDKIKAKVRISVEAAKVANVPMDQIFQAVVGSLSTSFGNEAAVIVADELTHKAVKWDEVL